MEHQPGEPSWRSLGVDELVTTSELGNKLSTQVEQIIEQIDDNILAWQPKTMDQVTLEKSRWGTELRSMVVQPSHFPGV